VLEDGLGAVFVAVFWVATLVAQLAANSNIKIKKESFFMIVFFK
jgi:hypothetical protein